MVCKGRSRGPYACACDAHLPVVAAQLSTLAWIGPRDAQPSRPVHAVQSLGFSSRHAERSEWVVSPCHALYLHRRVPW